MVLFARLRHFHDEPSLGINPLSQEKMSTWVSVYQLDNESMKSWVGWSFHLQGMYPLPPSKPHEVKNRRFGKEFEKNGNRLQKEQRKLGLLKKKIMALKLNGG